jgi:uncharacterized damage-inducible protein DinB
MITPDYARTMAAYNAEMNRRLYDASARLSDEARRADRGAFWGSIHGTLNHVLWGDRNWMSRFAGWEPSKLSMKDSVGLFEDFADLHAARIEADARMLDWGGSLDPAWLAEDQVWFSGAAQRELRMPRGLLVTHMFNHQTHHRGQVHAMITAAGEKTGDTDLFILVAPQ